MPVTQGFPACLCCLQTSSLSLSPPAAHAVQVRSQFFGPSPKWTESLPPPLLHLRDVTYLCKRPEGPGLIGCAEWAGQEMGHSQSPSICWKGAWLQSQVKAVETLQCKIPPYTLITRLQSKFRFPPNPFTTQRTREPHQMYSLLPLASAVLKGERRICKYGTRLLQSEKRLRVGVIAVKTLPVRKASVPVFEIWTSVLFPLTFTPDMVVLPTAVEFLFPSPPH